MLRKTRIAAAIGVVLALGFGTTASADDFEWRARPMVGANEVPANTSTAEARASFEKDDGVIHYKIRMRKPITGAFMGHIHAQVAGKNGPIVVWLFGDIKLGESVSGLRLKKSDTEYEVVKITKFGPAAPKAPKAAGDAKPTEKKP